MKYFNLQTTIDLDVAGEVPQVAESRNSEFGSPFSLVEVVTSRFLEQIPLLELERGQNAKLTDILSSYSVPFGLIVSSRLKDLLLKFKLPPHKFYPFKLIDGGTVRDDYFWFHCYDDLWQYVDSSRSRLEVYRMFKHYTIAEYPLKTSQQIERVIKSLGLLQGTRLKEIYFLENFPGYDIILNDIVSLDIWISEGLKEALESEEITGYDIEEVAALREWGKEQEAKSQRLK